MKSTKFLAAGVITAAVLAFGGISAFAEEETEELDLSSMDFSGAIYDDAADYVTLGDYSNLSLEKSVYEISDEYLQEYITYNLEYDQSEEAVEDRGSAEGDTVDFTMNVQITGEEDLFLEDDEWSLTIGEDTLGEAFDDAITGLMAGDSFEVTVSYEEDDEDAFYEEWMGQEVTFTGTIDSVYLYSTPEYNEDYVKEQGYDSIEDYEAAIREEIEEENESSAESELVNSAFTLLVDDASFDGVPQEEYDAYKESITAYYEEYAEMFGVEFDELLSMFGMDEDTLAEEAVYEVNLKYAVSALCLAEGIEVTDDTISAYANALYEDYGYDSAEDFLNDYGTDFVYSIYYDAAGQWLIEHADVTEVLVDEEDLYEDYELDTEDYYEDYEFDTEEYYEDYDEEDWDDIEYESEEE